MTAVTLTDLARVIPDSANCPDTIAFEHGARF
jgi:hypothetical protein